MLLPRELRPLLTLAGPVILAEIGWMAMGVVDTVMVAPLGPAAIGAAGIGSSVFTAIVIFGMGLMLGLDALVSQAHGARNPAEALRWLHHGMFLACLIAPVLGGLVLLVAFTMRAWDLHPDIHALAQPYLRISVAGALPLLFYACFRRYLQGLHVVRPIMYALVSANLVNAGANWVLIYGNLGLPALGVEGSAWATVVARGYMAAFLGVSIVRLHRARGREHPAVPYAVSATRARRLVQLGVPAASQISLEVGAFAAATALAGRLDPVSSASHQIALNVASLAFMVPLGLASASAVRVGHAVGAHEPDRAVQAGWTALALGGVLMGVIGVMMFVFPAPVLRLFTTDPRVIEIGTTLLAIAAAFQLFDGTQAVATGVLRGVGDTRTPMAMNVVGHWVLGLPIGYGLCFGLGWGVVGLWLGLSVGLIFVALVLTGAWARRTRQLA